MRGVALACVLAACGTTPACCSTSHPGDPSVARVEVLLPDGQPGNYMGLPPMATRREASVGRSTTVVDTTGWHARRQRRLRVLLTPGEVTTCRRSSCSATTRTTRRSATRSSAIRTGDPRCRTRQSAHLSSTSSRSRGARRRRDDRRDERRRDSCAGTVTTLDDASAKCHRRAPGHRHRPHRERLLRRPRRSRLRRASPNATTPGTCASGSPGSADDHRRPSTMPSTLDACRVGDSAGCRDGRRTR